MTDNEETILLAFVAIVAITLIVTFVFVLAWYVIMAVALMTFFRKVGVEPWIAWVPLYSTWKWLEVGGQTGAFALFSLIPYGSIVTSVFLYIGMYRTGIAFGRDTGFFVLGLFLPFVWAFMLGQKDANYEPQRLAFAGYPPPLAGYGSAR